RTARPRTTGRRAARASRPEPGWPDRTGAPFRPRTRTWGGRRGTRATDGAPGPPRTARCPLRSPLIHLHGGLTGRGSVQRLVPAGLFCVHLQPLERQAVDRRWAEPGDCRPVLGRPVAPVLVEAVFGKTAMVPLHDPIPGHLRHHGGGRHRRTHRVALLDREVGQLDGPEPEAVAQHEVGPDLEPVHRLAEQLQVRHVESPMVDPPGERPAYGHRHGLGPDPFEPQVPLERGELLRVPEALDDESVWEDDRRGDQEAGQRAAARFVHPGDQPEPLGTQAPLVQVDVSYNPWSHRIRDRGHTVTKTRPITLSNGIIPRENRESREFVRLSPMTNRLSAGTLIGP